MVSMTEEAKRAALAGFDFFKGLTDREISDIAKLAEEREFRVGEELCRESDFGTFAFVVLFPTWFFRYARSLWLGFDQFIDPRAGEQPDDPPGMN